MSRLDDIVKYLGWHEPRVLRQLAEEFEEYWTYYSQFRDIDERIYAAWEKLVNKKLIGCYSELENQ